MKDTTEYNARLRAAAVAIVGVKDTLEKLTAMRDELTQMGAQYVEGGAIALSLVNVLIEGHEP